MKNVLWISVLVWVMAVACGSKPASAPVPGQGGAPAPLVDVMPVQTERVLETLDVVGTLEPNEKVSIKPEIAGRIVRMGGEEGNTVKQGDVLVELDPGKLKQDLALAEAKLSSARQNVLEQRERLASARAKIAQARAGVDRARQDVGELIARLARASAVLERARQDEARTRSLYEKEFKTKDDLEKAVSAIKQAEADKDAVMASLGGEQKQKMNPEDHAIVKQALAAVEAAKSEEQAILAGLGQAADKSSDIDLHPEVQRAHAEISLAKEKLKDLTLIAPMNGVLSVRHAAAGDYVDKGTLIFELIDLSSVKTAFRVPERHISRIRMGQSAELRVAPYPGETFRGVVYYIDPMIDENSRTVLMKMRIPNAGHRLKPGLFANVQIVIGEFSDATVIPEESVVPQGGNFFAFVVESGRAVQRPIKIGLRQAGKVQILEGLAAGEQVVVAGLQKIRDGAPVRINSGPGGS